MKNAFISVNIVLDLPRLNVYPALQDITSFKMNAIKFVQKELGQIHLIKSVKAAMNLVKPVMVRQKMIA